MKVLLLNGSPRKEGNTSMALGQVAEILEAEGIETVNMWIGNEPVRGCIGCGACAQKGRCVFHDILYEEILAVLDAGVDALVVGTPVYFAGPNGSLCAILDRIFYSAGDRLAWKPAAGISVCRRGGASASFDRLNKYFAINNMPIAGSQYWTIAYGRAPGEVASDGEGMQTLRAMARNLAWMMRTAATEQHPAAEEPRQRTNFVR